MRSRSVLIVHREHLVAEGLAASLGRFFGLVSGGVATTAREARHAASGRIDAVALDSRVADAAELAAELRGKGIRVVLIGAPVRPDGGVWVPTSASLAELAAALVPSLSLEAPAGRTLTRREREILELVAKGLPGKQVATHLGISPKTVEQHKTRIFAKLGVSNQTAAVSRMLGGLATELVAPGSGIHAGRA